MRLIKWVFCVFMLVETENHSLAKTYILTNPTETQSNEENLTFPNRFITNPEKSNNDQNKRKLKFSDMIREAQQKNNGFSPNSLIKSNKASTIKIHCCKKSNSVIVCKNDLYKYIIKLNNNILPQDQVGALVRSIYTFTESLTANNCNFEKEAPTTSTIPAAYQVLSNTERFNQIRKFLAEQKKKHNSSTIYSPIANEYNILQSKSNHMNNKCKKVQASSLSHQSKIIECSLNANTKLNKGKSSMLNKFHDPSRGSRNLKKEPTLKLSCKLTGSQSSPSKMFTIPVHLTDSESETEKNGENYVYEQSLKNPNSAEKQNANYHGHHIKKRSCRPKYQHSVQNIKTHYIKHNINSSDRNQSRTDSNKNTNHNKNTNFKSNNTEHNDHIDKLFHESNDTLKHKLNSVKAWMFNLKEKKLNKKSDTKDSTEKEKQSHFLFHTKNKTVSSQINSFNSEIFKKNKDNKSNVSEKLTTKFTSHPSSGDEKYNFNELCNGNRIANGSKLLKKHNQTSDESTKKQNKTTNKNQKSTEPYRSTWEDDTDVPTKAKKGKGGDTDQSTKSNKDKGDDIDQSTKANKGKGEDQPIKTNKGKSEDTDQSTQTNTGKAGDTNKSSNSTGKSKIHENSNSNGEVSKKNYKTHKKSKHKKKATHPGGKLWATTSEELEDTLFTIQDNIFSNSHLDEGMTEKISSTTNFTSYFYNKFLNMKDKKYNYLKSFKFNNNNINNNNKEYNKEKENEQNSGLHSTFKPVGNIFKDILNKHSYLSPNETIIDRNKDTEQLFPPGLKKIIVVGEKQEPKNINDDYKQTTEDLKLFTEFENSIITDNSEDDKKQNEKHHINDRTEEIKRKINEIRLKQPLLLRTLNFNQDRYRNLEAFKEKENRRKRLFDFISYLKRTRNNFMKNPKEIMINSQ